MNIPTEALAAVATLIGSAALGFAFKVSREVVTLQTQMSVVWPQVKFVTAMNMHSPDDHHGMDQLLIKYVKGSIVPSELQVLVGMAKKIKEQGSEEDKLKAEGLLRMIEFEYRIH